MINAALVLEGGSLRGMFTCGVLDTFLEEQIEFCYVNGVSAGGMNGMNYISKQIGRSLEINSKYLHDKRYISFKNMVRNRLLFNFDFLFGELSQNLVPYDFDAFYASPQKYEVVATRCRTGKPEYFEKSECKDILKAIQASASIPIMSKMIDVDGRKYLDGGVSLPIAYERAFELGYDKVVVILTREQGYRKKQLDRFMLRGYEHYFEPLPELLEALKAVPDRYNRMQEEMDRLEQQGRLFIIRPEFPVKVSRVEQDMHKLEALYHEGQRIGRDKLKQLTEYLQI